MYEQQILQTLDEIKQALKAIYGEGEEQDSLISNIERNIKNILQIEINKLQRQIDALNYKLTNVPKLLESISNLSKRLERIDFEDMQGDVNYIRVTLGNFEAKLSSIDRKIK